MRAPAAASSRETNAWLPAASCAQTLVAFKAAVPAAHIEAVCGPHETHDLMCLRFLRARQFDVPAAAAMLASTAAWHAAEHPREWAARGASACLGCEHDELIKFYRLTYVPTADRDGRPLYVEACGDVNIDGVRRVPRATAGPLRAARARARWRRRVDGYGRDGPRAVQLVGAGGGASTHVSAPAPAAAGAKIAIRAVRASATGLLRTGGSWGGRWARL